MRKDAAAGTITVKVTGTRLMPDSQYAIKVITNKTGELCGVDEYVYAGANGRLTVTLTEAQGDATWVVVRIGYTGGGSGFQTDYMNL